MKRKDFLKGAGLAGVAGIFGFKKLAAGNPVLAGNPVSGIPGAENLNLLTCTVTPTETAGPFPWASGTNIQNSVFWRSDIREPNSAGSGQGCIPLTVKLRILNVANCTPIANARVDLWHCNEQGSYSGYGSYVGATWLRGIQQTDYEGFVTFQTIFPSWYSGRINHIHFQVFVGGVSKLVSQLCFPVATMDAIHGIGSTPGKPPYGPTPYPGPSGYTFATDNVFSNGTAGQMVTMSGDVNRGLVGTLDVVVSYGAVSAPANINNFNGGLHDGKAMLWWSAEKKENFSHFLIEKSHDWEDFEPVARVEGKGILGGNEHYSFTDPKNLDGETQYRLTIFDTDGNSDSTVYLPFRPEEKTAKIATNPANEHLVVQHNESKSGEAHFSILNSEGQELLRGPIQVGATASLLDVKNLRGGDYLLVFDDSTRVQVLPFSKKF